VIWSYLECWASWWWESHTRALSQWLQWSMLLWKRWRSTGILSFIDRGISKISRRSIFQWEHSVIVRKLFCHPPWDHQLAMNDGLKATVINGWIPNVVDSYFQLMNSNVVLGFNVNSPNIAYNMIHLRREGWWACRKSIWIVHVHIWCASTPRK
jgi:hypothetical protein